MKPSVLVFLFAAALAGCGDTELNELPDGGVADAAPPEADAMRGVDAAAPPPESSPAAMVLSAGGRVAGATFTLDVQIGEAMVPRPVGEGELVLAPHGAIQP